MSSHSNISSDTYLRSSILEYPFNEPFNHLVAGSISTLILCGIILLATKIYGRAVNKLPFPPGPPRLPLIGNLHQAPRQLPWMVYGNWAKKYGPLYMLSYAGHKFMVISDFATVRDLLEKKSNKYSSRPQMPLADKDVNKGIFPSLNTYDGNARSHERLRLSILGPRIAHSYIGVQDTESKQVLYDLLSSNGFKKHLTRYATSLIFALAYGKRLPNYDDEEVQETQWILSTFFHMGKIGIWVIDVIPLLNRLGNFFLPEKRYAKKLVRGEVAIHNRNMENALNSPSWNWCKHLRRSGAGKEMDELELAYDIGCVLCAATETTSNTLQSFIVAAVLHPDIMAKARKELDDVVGPHRLPAFEDKNNLPYIQAMVYEVFRWLPTTNLGVPHCLTEDDCHNGYHIPKGSTVIANHFFIFRDPAVYASPDSFIPERWLENPDLPMAAFGWGRRACPGHQIARNSVFIAIARLVWAFDLKPIGSPPDPLNQTDDRFSQGPKSFQVDFKVRNEHTAEVIRNAWANAEKDIDILMAGVEQAQSNKV